MESFNQAEWDIVSVNVFTMREMGRPWKLLLTFNSIPLADVLKIDQRERQREWLGSYCIGLCKK